MRCVRRAWQEADGRGCAEQSGEGLSPGAPGQVFGSRGETSGAARLSPVAIHLSCLRQLAGTGDSPAGFPPLPSQLSLQQHWLARLPSQIRLIVRFNKVLPLCELAVIASRWKWVLHNPDTSGMQECTAPVLAQRSCSLTLFPGVSL